MADLVLCKLWRWKFREPLLELRGAAATLPLGVANGLTARSGKAYPRGKGGSTKRKVRREYCARMFFEHCYRWVREGQYKFSFELR